MPTAEGVASRMVTIFSIPKEFTGRTELHQRNAIASWRSLGQDVEIILFGADPGTAEAANEFSAIHCPEVETSEYGTPLLHSAFRSAQVQARWPIVLFVNADIILLPDLLQAVHHLEGMDRFLACGQRINLDVEDEIRWTALDSLEKLKDRVRTDGKLHPPKGSDYFLFRSGMVNLPEFSVGRPGWDNWLIFWARSQGIPVVDATKAVTAVHQNHDYSHSKFGAKTRVSGPEHEMNIRLAGGFSNMLDLHSADWIIDGQGLEKKRLVGGALAALQSSCVMRTLLGCKRRLQHTLMRE